MDGSTILRFGGREAGNRAWVENRVNLRMAGKQLTLMRGCNTSNM